MRRQAPTIAVILFSFLTTALLFAAPNILRYGFPVLAAITAIVLFTQTRTGYIQFCFWLWFLSPLVRRLVDFRTEFVATSPLLLAPFLAASISGVVLLRNLRSLSRRENAAAIPFACALAGIAFGTFYGLTRYAPVEVGRALLNWLAPLLFASFLYLESSRHPERLEQYRDTIVATMLRGTLLMSVYGLVQFFALPAWDRDWMIGLKQGTFGEARALEVRVFSTMNNPALFSTYLVAGLLLAFVVLSETGTGRDKRSLRILATLTAPLGLVVLGLTLSRALWLGLACGILFLAFTLPSRARLRVVATVLLALVLAGAATLAPGIHEVVVKRLKTFANGSSDVSASARLYGHTEALAQLASEPLGEGMGSTDTDHNADGSDDRLGPHDSTLLEFLFALGAPGTLLYGIGLAVALTRIFMRRGTSEQPTTPMAYALRAILFAVFAECLLNSILLGVPGFLVWTCFALALAAADPAIQRRRINAETRAFAAQ